MTHQDEAARAGILARLADSRAELLRILDPPRDESGPGASGTSGSMGQGFPRSRTMRMLMSGRGLGTLGAVAAGLLVARPAMALRLLRLIPTSAVVKLIVARVFANTGEKSQ